MVQSDFPDEFTVQSRTGAILVRTTEGGLPVGIAVDPGQLRRDPAELAAEILRLCKQSAARAGAQRRKQLAEAGFTADMLRLTGLPTEEEVARQEVIEEQEYENEPDSWLRSI